MSKKWQLDTYCLKIILTMTAKNEPVRFNELSRMLNPDKDFPDMQDSTLSDHLKHLVENGYVRRKEEIVEHKPRITYGLNFKKIEKIRSFAEVRKELLQFYVKNAEVFYSLPVNEQVQRILHSVAMMRLHRISAVIDFKLDPHSWEKNFLVNGWSWSLRGLLWAEAWLIDKAVKDEKYRKEVFEEINKLTGEKA